LTPIKRTAIAMRKPRVPSSKAATAGADTAVSEPRGARRKRETRARLLDAALQLMSEKGMEGVAVNEITEAADVGFGSFYNHFDSKEAIYNALMEETFERFADALDRLVEGVTDPAEIISISVRHTLLRALDTPVWGRFMIREGLSAHTLTRGLGRRLLRDIQRGIDAGRFKVDDPMMTFIAVAGAVMGAISAALPSSDATGSRSGPTLIRRLGFKDGEVPERTAAIVLRTLGLPAATSVTVAHRPLPALAAEPTER
jgi:AcrR family transcriptional regulator